MNLSNELFEQITASLAANSADGEPAAAAADDQRAGRRVVTSAGQRATLIPLTDSIASAPIGVTLRDVSPGGVGFLHAGRVALNDEFVLILPSSEGNVAILCGVAYWQPVAEGMFAIGAKFTRVLRQGMSKPVVVPAAVPARKAV
jgi:hypothetical protein